MLAALVSKSGQASLTGVALLHLCLGAGTVYLTARAAQGSGLSKRRADLAAFIVACDPILVWQSRSVMTETPTAFLLALGFAGLARPAWQGPVLGGTAFGLAALCRPSVLPGTLLAIIAAAIARPGSRSRRVLGLSEPAADRYFRNKALALAREQPADFVRATLARLGHFWALAPVVLVYPAWARIAILVWTVPLLLGLFQPSVWSMAASRRAAGDCAPHGRPRVLLDRPQNAGAHHPGHRPGRRRCVEAGQARALRVN